MTLKGMAYGVNGPDRDGYADTLDTPTFRVWNDAVIQTSGCEVVPVATYAIRATLGEVEFSDPVTVDTSPGPASEFWAEVVGQFDGSD